MSIPISFYLTKGAVCTIDFEDSDLLQYRWSELVRGENVYAKSSKYIDGKQQLIHRMILERVEGRVLERTELVDHIDRNALNCKRDNLRIANGSQNGGNRRLNKNNTTGYRGVYEVKVNGRFEAKIRIEGKVKSIGTFGTAEEAYERYKEAALRKWGEFARL